MKTRNQIFNFNFKQTFFVGLFVLIGFLEISAQTVYTLSSGTTTSSSEGLSPVRNNYYNNRRQYLIRASELTALGASAGDITALAVYAIAVSPKDFYGFNISMGLTTSTALSTTFISSLTTVYSNSQLPASTFTANVWSTINFQTPFYWDGTSNVVIQFCNNNPTGEYSSTGTVRIYTPTGSFNASAFHNNDASGGCTSAATASTSTSRPHLRLTITPPVVTKPSIFNTGSSTNQLTFNNAHIKQDAPIFRVSSTHVSGSFNRIQVEINTLPNFTGTSYIQTHSGTFANNTQYDLICNNMTPAFPATDNTTYYVRIRGSHNGGTNWGTWTTQVHSFTSTDDCPKEWYQTEYGQFDGNDIQNLRTNDAANDYMDVNVGMTAGLGNTTEGATTNNIALAQNTRLFSKITVPSPTTVTHLKAYVLTPNTAGTSWIWMGLYKTDGTLIAQIPQYHPTTVVLNGVWLELAVVTPVTIPAGTYYIAYQTSSSSNELIYEINVGEPNGSINSLSPNYTNFISSPTSDTYFSNVSPLPGAFTHSLTHRYNLAISGNPAGGVSTTNAGTLVQSASFQDFTSWDKLTWDADLNGGVVKVQVLYHNGSNIVLIPDAALLGNAAGFNPNQSPVDLSGLNTTTYANIYVRVSMENGVAVPGPRFYSWSVSVLGEQSTSPSSIDGVGSACFGTSVTLEPVGGVLEPGHQWGWYTGSCGGTLVHIGDTYTVSPTATTTYYVGAVNANGCPTSPCASGTVTLPTIGTTLAHDEDNAVCLVNANNFVHFYHSSGRLIASINSNGQNLGNVTMTAYVEGAPVDVQACGGTSPSTITTVMNRHWVITPEFQPTSAVTVRLPYDDTQNVGGEYNMLFAAANGNANLNDDLSGYGSILLSKYSGPLLVDDNADNNCTPTGSGGTTLHSQSSVGGTVVSYISPFENTARYVDYSIGGFSEFWLHGNTPTPLPIVLSNMKLSCYDDSKVALNWSTSSESNSLQFKIERSRNNQLWETVGFVNAAGNSTVESMYQFVDQNSISNDEVYYRLILIDTDGSETIYGPWNSNCNGNYNVNLYPNPNEGSFTINIHSDEIKNTAAIMNIIDVTGKLIYSQDLTVNTGSNNFLISNLDLSKGTYMLELNTDEGSKKPFRFVVK